MISLPTSKLSFSTRAAHTRLLAIRLKLRRVFHTLSAKSSIVQPLIYSWFAKYSNLIFNSLLYSGTMRIGKDMILFTKK